MAPIDNTQFLRVWRRVHPGGAPLPPPPPPFPPRQPSFPDRRCRRCRRNRRPW